jgi:ferredoxin hydrogenase large subunit/hydrogenase large subunit
MAAASFHVSRAEGRVALAQDDSGTIRLVSTAPRDFEGLLAGRSPLEAVYLTQQISADSGVSHALAAVTAWERAVGLNPPANGILLRDLLHALSLLHAHVRHFYLQALPDYIAAADLAAYRGSWPELQRISRAVAAHSPAWAKAPGPHPFNAAQVDRLAESRLRAVRTLGVLQRMLALLGGKFPVAMSIVPGGCSVALSDALLLRLRRYLAEARPFLDDQMFEDGLLVVQHYPRVKTLGGGSRGLLCAGTLGEDEGPTQSMVPAGAYIAGHLESFERAVTESIARAYYRFPGGKAAPRALLQPAADKPGAYSWIKAPRFRGAPMETGALARLVITQVTGSRSHLGSVPADIEAALGASLEQGNTVAGRMLSRLGEARLLTARCAALLERLYPAQPAVAPDAAMFSADGVGVGDVEAPAGAVRHRLVLERGQIASYDIITPSTWNGSPSDERGEPGPLEAALNAGTLNLAEREGRLAASRIVHSFCFSMADAVH